jgi:hypothetical protein
VIFEGWVLKKSKYLGDWRARWFVLTPNFLYSYKEEKNYSSATEQIALLTIDKVFESTNESGYYNFQIRQNNGTLYNLRTKKSEERNRWIFEINKTVNMKYAESNEPQNLTSKLLAKQHSHMNSFSTS